MTLITNIRNERGNHFIDECKIKMIRKIIYKQHGR